MGRGRAAALLAVIVALLTVWLVGPASAAGETFIINVTLDGNNVAGVHVTVATPEGKEVGSGISDDKGQAVIELPGPGTYRASIDPASFPEGAKLDKGQTPTVERRIFTGGTRTVLFALIKSGRAKVAGAVNRPLQLFAEGIRFGLVIAMAAIGLSLIFGTTGLTNFAHGEMVTFGAVMTWFVNVHMGLNLLLAAPIGMILGGAAGALQDWGLWRPLRRRGTGLIGMLVVSIGLSIASKNLMLMFFGGRSRPFSQYSIQRGLDLGPISLAARDLVVIGLSVVVLAGVGLLLQRTRLGTATRAVADNRDLAASSGINVDHVIMLVWVVGGALAALGGVFAALTSQVGVDLGAQLLLLMFAGVTLGGLGTAYGALVGSIIVGVFIQMSTLVVAPELKNAGALFVLILILLVRPQGLLGRRERVG